MAEAEDPGPNLTRSCFPTLHRQKQRRPPPQGGLASLKVTCQEHTGPATGVLAQVMEMGCWSVAPALRKVGVSGWGGGLGEEEMEAQAGPPRRPAG